MRKCLLCLCLYCALAFAAWGQIVPVLISVTPNGDGSFTYTYNVDLAEDANAAANDYFVLYDFGPLLAPLGPAGWEFFANPVTPPGVVPVQDHPLIPNVGVRRTATTILGPADLGNFSIRSSIGLVGSGQFASRATQSQGATAGTPLANIGSVSFPLRQRYTISGTVTEGARGLPGVTVTLYNDPGYEVRATTDARGAYALSNVLGGLNYKVEPSKTGYAFTPPGVAIANLGSNTVQNFSAARSGEGPRLNIRLSWPQSVSGFNLQSTEALAGPAWSTITNEPAVTNGEQVIELPADGAQKYFRLEEQR